MTPADSAAPDPPGEPDAPAAPAILNVNDDDANRFALTRILRKSGYRVEEARDGAEALRLVSEWGPDLVMLDVDLPDIDGFEVCRRIKADPETAAIPVLHLSAQYVMEEDRTLGLASGADGYLIQPVEPLELNASIRGLLRMRRAEDAARQGALRIEQLEGELRRLEQMAAAPPPSSARGPQPRPLREADPGAFAELVARCQQLLDQAVQQQRYKVQHNVAASLRELGDRLGALGAGPRDVVEVYGAALKSRSSGALAPRSRAYIDEGRLLALELMGHLVTYYRDAPAERGRDPEA